MINDIFKLLVAVGLCAVAYYAYNSFWHEREYPAHMTVHHVDGRELEIYLTGRTGTEMYFTRDLDGQSFTFPLIDLSDVSRQAVMRYPKTVSVDYHMAPNKTLGEIHLAEMIEAQAALEKEEERVTLLYRAANSEVAHNTYRKQLQEIRTKIKDYEVKIHDQKERNAL